MKKRHFFMGSLLLLFVLFVVFYIRGLYIKSSTEVMAFFEPSVSLQQLFHHTDEYPLNKTIRIVYFWQSDCPCDQFIKPHFLLMMDKYLNRMGLGLNTSRKDDQDISDEGQHIEFYLASLDGKKASADLGEINPLSETLLSRVRADVQATPSVGIWNKEGELVYFGPHTIGYICNDDTSMVKKVVDALLEKQPFSALSVMGDGCFCPVNAT